MIQIIARGWQKYNKALVEYPLSTRSLTSMFILGGADATCQKLEGAEKLNMRRTGSMALTGLVLIGPSVKWWYGLLDRRIGSKPTLVNLTKKLALDQAFFAPAMFGLIMSSINILNGKSIKDTKTLIQDQYWTVLKNSWRVWPAATTINFALVPLQYRVLFNNSVSFCWNTYLSSVTLSSKTDQPKAIKLQKKQPSTSGFSSIITQFKDKFVTKSSHTDRLTKL